MRAHAIGLGRPLLVAFVALFLLVFIVWWTMFHRRYELKETQPVQQARLVPSVYAGAEPANDDGA